MIRQETIVRILLESENGSIENDGTRSMAGHINRTQYHDVADKILKLADQPNVKFQLPSDYNEQDLLDIIRFTKNLEYLDGTINRSEICEQDIFNKWQDRKCKRGN